MEPSALRAAQQPLPTFREETRSGSSRSTERRRRRDVFTDLTVSTHHHLFPPEHDTSSLLQPVSKFNTIRSVLPNITALHVLNVTTGVLTRPRRTPCSSTGCQTSVWSLSRWRWWLGHTVCRPLKAGTSWSPETERHTWDEVSSCSVQPRRWNSPIDTGHTFLHYPFDSLEQAWVLLRNPVGHVTSIIQNLTSFNKWQIYVLYFLEM